MVYRIQIIVKENVVDKMIEKIKELSVRYKGLLLYGIFGVLTTVINIVVYAAANDYFGISNVMSNVIAWVASVIFAYITNKIWVFESKSMVVKVLLFEIITFFGCRLATGLLDLAIMYVSVDKLGLPNMGMKCLSNVIVIVANYVASKLVIFKKAE